MKTVFVDVFCTPKCSMEKPSLRVNGHGSSTSRTFIVENCVMGEQLTKYLVSKVTLMMKDRVFGHGTTTRTLGSPDRLKVAK